MRIKGVKLGFTLTEIMIALAILGVIAALTIPGMQRDYTRREFQTAISKFYTDLLQVGPLAQVTSGYNNLMKVPAFQSSDNTWPETYLRATYRGTGAKAPSAGKTNGFADSYRSLNGTGTLARTNFCTEDGVKTFVLDNGFVICSVPVDSNDNNSILLYVDVNGSKSPNIAGLDFFRLNIVLNNSEGDVEETGYISGNSAWKCESNANAKGCFGSLLENNLKITYY